MQTVIWAPTSLNRHPEGIQQRPKHLEMTFVKHRKTDYLKQKIFLLKCTYINLRLSQNAIINLHDIINLHRRTPVKQKSYFLLDECMSVLHVSLVCSGFSTHHFKLSTKPHNTIMIYLITSKFPIIITLSLLYSEARHSWHHWMVVHMDVLHELNYPITPSESKKSKVVDLYSASSWNHL